jgi:hypothetical protein
MENISQNEPLASKPRVGVAGKLLSVAAGAAAGVGAMVVAVNSSIRQNLKRWSEPGFKAFDKYGEKLHQDESMLSIDEGIANIRSEARKALKNKIIATVDDGEARRVMSDAKGVMGKAIGKARSAQRYDSLSDVQIHNALNQMENGQVGLRQDIARLVVDDEKRMLTQAFEEVPSYISLKDKLSFSKDLHLTSGQKSTAALAFVGAAAVTAGAVHYLMKQHAKNRQLQATDMSQFAFNV